MESCAPCRSSFSPSPGPPARCRPVRSPAREAFTAHHRGWGTSVRVADVELAGMHARSEHDVEILVRVAWYRPEEQELHTTTVKQGWSDKNGWQLVNEVRLDGD